MAEQKGVDAGTTTWDALEHVYGDDERFSCRKHYDAMVDINGVDPIRMIGFELATIADALCEIAFKEEEEEK